MREVGLERQFNSLGERIVASLEYFLGTEVATSSSGVRLMPSNMLFADSHSTSGIAGGERTKAVLNLCQLAAINCVKVKLKNESSRKSCWHLN